MSLPGIKGIRQAVSDFNSWCGAARIYFDKSSKEVWTNIYDGPQSWHEYPDDDIVEVAQKAIFSAWERDNRITRSRLTELCVEALNNDKVIDKETINSQSQDDEYEEMEL